VALAALLLAATSASAAMQMLSPFTLSAQHQNVNGFPSSATTQWTSFQVVSHTFELLLMYFPLGFCFPLIVWAGAVQPIAVAGSVLAMSVGLEWRKGGSQDAMPRHRYRMRCSARGSGLDGSPWLDQVSNDGWQPGTAVRRRCSWPQLI